MGYTHGTKWTSEIIRESLLNIVKKLDIDRMPSRNEIRQFSEYRGLPERISKEAGGYYKWAERLGLEMKESETGLGKKYEALAYEKIISLGHDVERMSQNFPYDILVDNAVKIDIKVSHLYRGNQGNFYSYNMDKPFCTCDIYVLYAINDDSAVYDTFIVPSVFVSKNKHISIGETSSIYHKYSQKWAYIDLYSDFMNNNIRAV